MSYEDHHLCGGLPISFSHVGVWGTRVHCRLEVENSGDTVVHEMAIVPLVAGIRSGPAACKESLETPWTDRVRSSEARWASLLPQRQHSESEDSQSQTEKTNE